MRQHAYCIFLLFFSYIYIFIYSNVITIFWLGSPSSRELRSALTCSSSVSASLCLREKTWGMRQRTRKYFEYVPDSDGLQPSSNLRNKCRQHVNFLPIPRSCSVNSLEFSVCLTQTICHPSCKLEICFSWGLKWITQTDK